MVPSAAPDSPSTHAAVEGISVIIPTHQRERSLRRCLGALARVRHDGIDLEVIVVNDGGAPLVVDDLLPALPGLRVIDQANAGPAGARNTGIAEARHAHLAFTDDDCLPEPAWLLDLVAALERHPTALIGGHTVNLLRDNPFSTASQCINDALLRWQNRNPEDGHFLPSYNLACQRQCLLAIGGFDARYRTGEDRDLCDRWRRAGSRIVQLRGGARVGHIHDLDHRSFWAQQRSYGRGSAAFHQSRERQGDPRPKAGLVFLLLLLQESLRQSCSRRQALLVALLTLESQLAILVGKLEQRRRTPDTAR